MTPRVAIIGAGIAGLRLGRRLATAGVAVEIYDKARGPAGRMATRRLPFGHFDHGAQYFTARAPAFRAQVEDWLARGVVAHWTPRVAVLERGAVEAEGGGPTRYVGTPGMSAIARSLAEGLPVTTGVRIGSVARRGSHWSLVGDDGHDYDGFDALVSAVPAPQALPFLAASPTLTRLAQSVSFRACHAVMVEPTAPLDVDFDAAFVHRSSLRWIARQASRPGRAPSNGWVLHSAAEWSEAHLELEPDRVLETLWSELAGVTGRALPPRRDAAVHRWLFARAEKPASGPSCWDAACALGVCGDWVAGDRVEEAFLSADRLADVVLADLLARGRG